MSTPPRQTHTTSSGTGIGCFTLAFFISLVLCILKEAGVLEISWLLALSPLIVVMGLSVVALLILLAVTAIIAAIAAFRNKRGRR